MGGFEACCLRHTFGAIDGSTPAFEGSGKAHYAPDTVLEPTHMKLEMDFTDMENFTLHATNTITFTNKIPSANKSALSSVVLNAVSFILKEVRGCRYSYCGKNITLLWDTPFKKNEERQVSIVAGLYFNVPNNEWPLRTLHCITDNEPQRCRHWLPCIDAPTCRTTLEFHLYAKSDFIAVANGHQISQTKHDNGNTTTVWRLDETPCPSYLICLAVGDYLLVPDGEVDGIPIAYMGPRGKQTEEDLLRTFHRTKSMIQWISSKLGSKFPWKKYYQVVSPQVRGAMENISFVMWNDLYCVDAVLTKEKQLLVDQVNIHEMAHTYFGDLLVIRHFDHTWLKESWATYFEALWMEEFLGQDYMRYELLDAKKMYISECTRYTRPLVKRVWDSPWAMFDAHAYPGGAWRIHMLRWKLGNELFWVAVRDYVSTYKGKVVETDDFKRCLEKASGLNLTKYFDQWIYGRGYPKLKATYKYTFEKDQIQIKVEQIQGAADSNVVKIFEMELEIVVQDSNGKMYNATLEYNESMVALVNITLLKKATPKTFRLDPLGKLLFSIEFSEDLPEDLLINTSILSDDIYNRIRSYEDLIKIGTSVAMSAVSKNIVKEVFWGVRIRVSSALSKAKTQACMVVLAQMLDSEEDPMATTGIIQGCKYRDPVLRTSLLKYLKRKSTTYKAVASALENIGRQNNPADLEYLANYASDDTKIGQHALIRSGALEALGLHTSRESFDFLEVRVRASFFRHLLKEKELAILAEPEKALPSLIKALATAALWQTCKATREHVVEIFVDLLRDSRLIIRKQAIWALCDMDAVDSFASIRTTKPTFPDQDWMFIERRLRATREESGESKVKELVRSLEEVEGRLRKMEYEYVSFEQDEVKQAFAGASIESLEEETIVEKDHDAIDEI